MMHQTITKHRQEIEAACRLHHVAQLAVFGSAVRADFDPSRSDVDFVVEFTEAGRQRAFDNFFGLQEALSHILGRRVDLVSKRAIRNPIFKTEVEATAEPIYAENTRQTSG